MQASIFESNDGLVLGVPFFVIAIFLMPTLFNVSSDSAKPNVAAVLVFFFTYLVSYFVISGCYEVLMLKYKGGTVGKMACGLIVVRPNGDSLGWGVCFGRFAMKDIVTGGIPYVNSILVLISAIMAGTDSEKRALHDRVCNTRVIYKTSAA